MHLPVPTARDVASFRHLLKHEFQIDLSDEEAWDWATRTLQIFYIQNYGVHPLCPRQPNDAPSDPSPPPHPDGTAPGRPTD